MVMTYPLDVTTFMDALPIQTLAMDLPEQMQISRMGNGEVLMSDLGERMWSGTVTLGLSTRAEAGRPLTLLNALRQAGRSFMAYDVRRPGPLLDLTGAALGSSTVTVNALYSSAFELSLAGLPPGYTLRSGDYLSFAYGTSPVRYALHQVVDWAVTAGVGGITPGFEVTPYLRTGVTVGLPVTLVKAACKAVLIPGTVQAGTGGHTIFSGTSFQFVQTLR
jgi:hypothetical protein